MVWSRRRFITAGSGALAGLWASNFRYAFAAEAGAETII